MQQRGTDEAAIAASEQFRQKAEEAARREAEAVQLRQDLARVQAQADQLTVQAAQLPGKVGPADPKPAATQPQCSI